MEYVHTYIHTHTCVQFDFFYGMVPYTQCMNLNYIIPQNTHFL